MWVPVPKTEASAATLPLLPVLRRELVEHRARQAERNLGWVRPDALVFTTTRGKPQSRRNVLRAVYTAGDNLGLNGEGAEPVGLHDLRHSFVAVAFERGLSAPEVAKLARHANPKVTLGMYAGLTDEGREKASETRRRRVRPLICARNARSECPFRCGRSEQHKRESAPLQG